jgi:hypothetical protein
MLDVDAELWNHQSPIRNLQSIGNALGSVQQLAETSGALSLDRNYDPFGNLEASTGTPKQF